MKRELTCTDVQSIITNYFLGSSQLALAGAFSISPRAIYNILYLNTYIECSRELMLDEYKTIDNYFKELNHRKVKGLGKKV